MSTLFSLLIPSLPFPACLLLTCIESVFVSDLYESDNNENAGQDQEGQKMRRIILFHHEPHASTYHYIEQAFILLVCCMQVCVIESHSTNIQRLPKSPALMQRHASILLLSLVLLVSI